MSGLITTTIQSLSSLDFRDILPISLTTTSLDGITIRKLGFLEICHSQNL